MNRSLPLLTLLAATLCVACRVGPAYERPAYPVPEEFRAVESMVQPTAEDPDGPTFGGLEWFEVFDDPALRQLIEQALDGNYDLRVAAERVLEARAFVTISNADLYPDINAGANYKNEGISENLSQFPVNDTEIDSWSVFADLSWEIDFWGRVASATEAARADLLATELARKTVIQTLVTELALAYFDLLELDQELAITRRTYESRQQSLQLVSLRLDHGVANKVEYRQAEGLVLQTAGLIPAFEQLIEQQENLIRLLIGGNPGEITRGLTLLEQDRTIEIPVGLPAGLLARRPDVVTAEQNLIAANARIGEAKALLYPSIRLTATGGLASQDLADLLEGDSAFWNITPGILMPIFNAGRLRSNVEVSESRQRQAALGYMQTLQIAFREVADALVAHEKTEQVRDWREQLEVTLQDQVNLSNDRYIGGVTSYLEVLDSERDHFSAEISLAQSIRDELFSFVLLYRALGGGWQGTAELAEQGEQAGASGVPSQGSGGG